MSRKIVRTEEERKALRGAYQRQYRLQNPNKIKEIRANGGKERSRKYYVNNREKIDAYKQKHRQENKEQYNAKARERHERNPLCQRINDYRRKYNLTETAYYEMLSKQENKCSICNTLFVGTPHVDHCHTTGRVRELLCGNCNRALGSVNDNIDILKNMIDYLHRHSLK